MRALLRAVFIQLTDHATMLIVKRETDESLEFEVGGITVTTRFLRVDGRRVTIGIDAPRDVRVLPNRKGSDVGVTQDKKTATEE